MSWLHRALYTCRNSIGAQAKTTSIAQCIVSTLLLCVFYIVLIYLYFFYYSFIYYYSYFITISCYYYYFFIIIPILLLFLFIIIYHIIQLNTKWSCIASDSSRTFIGEELKYEASKRTCGKHLWIMHNIDKICNSSDISMRRCLTYTGVYGINISKRTVCFDPAPGRSIACVFFLLTNREIIFQICEIPNKWDSKYVRL